MATLTFTSDTQFTAVQNCSVISGSAVPAAYDFTTTENITLNQGSASIAIASGALTAATTASLSAVTDPGDLVNVPYALISGALTGDFDVQVDISSANLLSSDYPLMGYRVDDDLAHAIESLDLRSAEVLRLCGDIRDRMLTCDGHCSHI